MNGKADAGTEITGGAFSNNILTLNRAVGNINIGGFTSGGAQSVNVSLSGSTLTVNVDGHSDSVTLPTSDTASISGSINVPTSLGYNYTSSSYTSKPYASFSNRVSELSGDVSIYSENIVVGFYGYGTATSLRKVSSVTSTVTYNINGSGTVKIYGGYKANVAAIIMASDSSFGYLSYTFNEGQLVSSSYNNLYVGQDPTFYITSVSIS